MNTIRLILTAFFAIIGVICIGLVALVYLASGTDASVATNLNESFFQVKADAETDMLIQQGIFTKDQESTIRGFIRRSYVADCVILVFGLCSGILALGVASFAAAYCSWLSYRFSVIQRIHKEAEPSAAANP